MEGERLEAHYRETLARLGHEGGMLGLIFRKAQNRIQDPAKLRRLIVELIGQENWSAMSADVKGDAYEGLLESNAQDVEERRRAVLHAAAADRRDRRLHPAAARRDDLRSRLRHRRLPARRPRLHRRTTRARQGPEAPPALRGAARHRHRRQRDPPLRHEPLPARHRSDRRPHPAAAQDRRRPARRAPTHFDVVLTNPPFGKKSSITVVNAEGEEDRQSLTYNRPDFWTTTSNKQLNFVQHVKSLLKIHGRAAVVVPDNVLFEGGAGEKIRRRLLHDCDVHTLLRLPTGIFYAQGVKANVLFFDRKPASE